MHAFRHDPHALDVYNTIDNEGVVPTCSPVMACTFSCAFCSGQWLPSFSVQGEWWVAAPCEPFYLPVTLDQMQQGCVRAGVMPSAMGASRRVTVPSVQHDSTDHQVQTSFVSC